jgi:hypothetical protein
MLGEIAGGVGFVAGVRMVCLTRTGGRLMSWGRMSPSGVVQLHGVRVEFARSAWASRTDYVSDHGRLGVAEAEAAERAKRAGGMCRLLVRAKDGVSERIV